MGVARYVITLGDEEITFEGPDGLSDKQIEELADKYLKTAKPGQTFKSPVYAGTTEAGEPAAPADSSALGAFLRGAPREALFNFGDEIASFGNAAIPGLAELDNLFGVTTDEQVGPLSGGDFWERVRSNMGATGAQLEADDQLHPMASATGKISGALSTLPRAATAIGSRLPEAVAARIAERPVSAAITLGTAGGAASGAGAGEEGTRAQSAALGGLAGGALGGTIVGAGQLLPWLTRNAGVLLNRGSDKEAIRQTIQALQRDGFDVTTPSGVASLKTALQEFTGKPVSLADIGGAIRARTGVGLRAPSAQQQQAIDVVRNRQAGQGQRIAGDVRANVAPRTDVHALDEQLVNQRAVEAQRLRDRALFVDAPVPPTGPSSQVVQKFGNEEGVLRTMGVEPEETFTRQVVPAPSAGVPQIGRTSRIIEDPELQQLARLPDAQRALAAARERATAERDLLAATGQPIDHLPDLTPGADLDMRTFDYLKRFLDDEVNSLYKRGDTATFKAGQAGQVKALRDAIRERLRTAVPEYGEYLDAYKGSSEMIDSLAAGRKYDELDPEQILADQAGRSTAGQELYRVGAARNILDTIRETRDTGNAASRVLNSDEARAQLAATGVTPTGMAALNKSVQQERILNLLPQELAGAQTAQRAMAQADANVGADVSVPFNPGSPLGWAGMVGRHILNRSSVNRNAAVNEAFLPRVLETNPAAIEATITQLEQQGNIAAAKLLRRQVRERRAALWGGSAIGAPVSLQEEE